MSNLAQQVLAHAASMPEGASLSAKALLHLGSRAAVDQALSRLARSGELLRAGPKLARSFAIYCAAQGQSISDTLSEAVLMFLEAKGEL